MCRQVHGWLKGRVDRGLLQSHLGAHRARRGSVASLGSSWQGPTLLTAMLGDGGRGCPHEEMILRHWSAF